MSRVKVVTCTWKDCKEKASHPQLDRNGDIWSNLCLKHHNELEEVIVLLSFDASKENIKKMLSVWVKASGGAKVMAESSPIPKRGADLIEGLLKL